MDQNVKEKETRLIAVKIKGKPYKMNMETNEVFEEIGTGKNKELSLIGIMKKITGSDKKIEYIIEPI